MTSPRTRGLGYAQPTRACFLPYLIQHADNPVDWWEWEPAAFAEARRRGVPVLLSVGYSSCHWCHVFARESFEDEVVAAFLNEHFVNIKVDREERPDIDAVYMEAVQAATGQGGWPMTVFLTPDAEPFYFGTYFPPAPRNGMPSFRQVLEGVRAAWADRRDEVAEVAGKIVRDLSQREISYGDTTAPGEEELTRALLGLTRDYDAQHGGFGGAPKFPPSMIVEFLLRHHARSGSEGALQMAADTCERMARGGIYDQLGGGFARYSVDREWQIPHFEKMLYDNALLCRVYAHLWRATGSELARRIALETADFMVRELRTDEGGSRPRSTPTVMTGLVDTSRVLITSGRRPSLPRCSAMRMRRLPRTTSGSRRTAPSRRGRLFFNFRSTRGCSTPRRSTPFGFGCSKPVPRGLLPGGTTRWSPPGTGSPSPRSPRPGPTSSGPTLSTPRLPPPIFSYGFIWTTGRISPVPARTVKSGRTPGCWRTTPMSPRGSSRWPP